MNIGRIFHTDEQSITLTLSKNNLFAIVGFFLGIIFIAVPIIGFLTNSGFYGNATSLRFIHGLIELSFLMIFCWWALISKYKFIAKFIFGVLVLAYLRRHAIDLAITIDLLYIEGFLAFGVIINRFALHKGFDFADSRRSITLILLFTTGLMTWSTIVWTVGLIKIGTLPVVQCLTVFILGISLLLTDWRDRFVYHTYSFIRNMSGWSNAFFMAILITTVLGLFARTNVVADFDSIWYGLRLNDNFFGDGATPFDSLNLSTFVYYYPKLYEMILSPMSNIGDFSTILGVSVFFWILLLVASYGFLIQFGFDLQKRIIVVSVIGTIPAILNMSTSTKGELIQALFFVMAIDQLVSFYKSQKINQGQKNHIIKSNISIILLFFSFMLLTISTRPSSLIYVALITILFILVVIKNFLGMKTIVMNDSLSSNGNKSDLLYARFFFLI
nr:hypothetical protein [Methylovulum sp.]